MLTPVPKAVEYTLQAAKGLEYAHHSGVHHFDVKPANMILTPEGTVKVLDLGLARLQRSGSHAASQQDALAGTVDYLAPERIAHPEQSDQRSDIYSLGCTLFFLLTARPVFEGQSVVEKLLAHRESPVPLLRTIRADVPEALDALFQRMVQKKPEARMASMTDVIQALRALMQGTPSRKRRVFLWAVALSLGVVTAGIALWFWLPRPGIGTMPTEAAEGPGEIRRFEGHTYGVRSVAFSPDGRQVVTGCQDCIIRLFDVESGAELRQLKGHTTWVRSVVFSENGKHVLSSSGGVFKNGKLVIGDDLSVRLWNLETATDAWHYLGHTSPVVTAVFSPHDRFIASGSNDGSIYLWDVGTAKKLHSFDGHKAHVMKVAYSPDGRRLLSGSADQTARVWDVATEKELLQFKGHKATVWSVAASPDGKWALSAGGDQTIRLWDVATGKEQRKFEGHTDQVMCAVFSPDGKQVLSGSMDRTVRLWDAETGQELHCFKGHLYEVPSVAFSPDGQRAVSASLDHTVRLWRLNVKKKP